MGWERIYSLIWLIPVGLINKKNVLKLIHWFSSKMPEDNTEYSSLKDLNSSLKYFSWVVWKVQLTFLI